MSTTLKDIAKKANVSVATASLALNNSEKVNHKTYEKIKKIAEELNYTPNARARALVKKATETIGLVIPEVENPFFAEMAQSIKNMIKESGYNLILCSTEYKSEEELRYINLFKSGLVDGAIFACLGDMMEEHNKMIIDLVKNNTPVVFVDREINNYNLIPVIKTDLFEGAYNIATYLINNGHKKIGFVGQSEERVKGYKKALQDNNIEINQDFIYYDFLTIEGGYKVGQKIVTLDELPTALICLNDEMAMGVIQSLTSADIDVPDDISIIGIDNIRMSEYYNPSLSTLHIPKKEMGKKAAEVLLKRIKKERLSSDEQLIIFPTELIVRKSSKRLN